MLVEQAPPKEGPAPVNCRHDIVAGQQAMGLDQVLDHEARVDVVDEGVAAVLCVQPRPVVALTLQDESDGRRGLVDPVGPGETHPGGGQQEAPVGARVHDPAIIVG